MINYLINWVSEAKDNRYFTVEKCGGYWYGCIYDTKFSRFKVGGYSSCNSVLEDLFTWIKGQENENN